jgi:transcriptional regulator
MYVPKHFDVQDLSRLDELARHDSFATLVSMREGVPYATHLPVIYRRDGQQVRLLGHWARPNPQWQSIAGQSALCMLHGPHAYVSPSFYPDPASRVPTWNYAAAHLYGNVRVFEDADALLALVNTLSEQYEAGRDAPWSLADADPALQRLAAGIVGFEMVVERIELKFKLNQNHPIDNQAGVAHAFMADADADARLLGEWMTSLVQARRDGGQPA